MTYLQHFFIEGKHLGTADRSLITVRGQLQPPESIAFWCPHCAEVWARAMIEEGNFCDIRFIPCKKHPHRIYQVSGSLHTAMEPEFNECFPEEVLKWEFERHLDYYERV